MKLEVRNPTRLYSLHRLKMWSFVTSCFQGLQRSTRVEVRKRNTTIFPFTIKLTTPKYFLNYFRSTCLDIEQFSGGRLDVVLEKKLLRFDSRIYDSQTSVYNRVEVLGCDILPICTFWKMTHQRTLSAITCNHRPGPFISLLPLCSTTRETCVITAANVDLTCLWFETFRVCNATFSFRSVLFIQSEHGIDSGEAVRIAEAFHALTWRVGSRTSVGRKEHRQIWHLF